jgi:hypothetical protein
MEGASTINVENSGRNPGMNGSITEWNALNGRGRVSGGNGIFMVSLNDCSSKLRAVLSNCAIPPDAPVSVTYNVGAGTAVNVDLA